MTSRSPAHEPTPVRPLNTHMCMPEEVDQVQDDEALNERLVAPAEGEQGEECIEIPVGEDATEDLEEIQPLRRAHDPTLPTPVKVEDHRRSHLPYRAWCKFCVMGRGLGELHCQQCNAEPTIPIVVLDYFFITEEGVKTRKELRAP